MLDYHYLSQPRTKIPMTVRYNTVHIENPDFMQFHDWLTLRIRSIQNIYNDKIELKALSPFVNFVILV